MIEKQAHATTRASRIIPAGREEVYAAFMDPALLVTWLPPGEMTGKIHEFDGRVGGGYRMSLFYPESEIKFRGKSADREDRCRVRFVELEPARKIVETVIFESTEAAFQGEMTISITLEDVAGGTHVTFFCQNLPPGLRPEDNEAGSQLSLQQLARRFE
jgi:uncharacterized protein YndB with AHSA1/START domain